MRKQVVQILSHICRRAGPLCSDRHTCSGSVPICCRGEDSKSSKIESECQMNTSSSPEHPALLVKSHWVTLSHNKKSAPKADAYHP